MSNPNNILTAITQNSENEAVPGFEEFDDSQPEAVQPDTEDDNLNAASEYFGMEGAQEELQLDTVDKDSATQEAPSEHPPNNDEVQEVVPAESEVLLEGLGEQPPANENVAEDSLEEETKDEESSDSKKDAVEDEDEQKRVAEIAGAARSTLTEHLRRQQGEPVPVEQRGEPEIPSEQAGESMSSSPNTNSKGSGKGLLSLGALASSLKRGVTSFRKDPQVKLAERYSASVELLDVKMRDSLELAWELDKSPLGQQRKILIQSGQEPSPDHYSHIMENNHELASLVERYENSVEAVGKQAKKVITDGKSAGMTGKEMSDVIGPKIDEFNEKMRKAVEGLFGDKGKKLFETVDNMLGAVKEFVSALFQKLTGGMRNA